MVEDKDGVIIKELDYSSENYKASLVLRDKVLRRPLGLSLYDENLERDKNDIHIGAFINNRIVGILILTRINADEIKMRQVAVDEEYRANYTGSKMVLFAEEYSKNNGYKTMLLHARKSATGFYKKLGYDINSDEFLEINIPHFEMRKFLIIQ